MSLVKKIILMLFLGITFVTTESFAVNTHQPAIKNFINYMVAEHGFSAVYLQQLFSKVKIKKAVLEKIQKPYENKPWSEYRTHFVNLQRINDGVIYWKKHKTVLQNIERASGVPASIIVAIVGVESNYGKKMMEYPALDSLTTLAFYYPPRADFFRNELVQFLLLTRSLHKDPREIYGSYAGAVGLPQFMPSSYRKYALAYTGHGYADLFHDNNDVPKSVANFLRQQGWNRGEPIAVQAKTFGFMYESLPQLNQQKNYTLRKLEGFNITPATSLGKNYSANFLLLPGIDRDEYWLVFNNFKVIMHYNTSEKYALAVTQLAEKIKKSVGAKI